MSRRKAVPKSLLVALIPVAIQQFRRLPLYGRVALVVLALAAFGVYWYVTHAPAPPVAPDADPTTGLNPDGSGTFQFCFWNVENLFDDSNDDRRSVDEPYDNAFATDAALRQQKLDHLASTLVKLNGGKGPDILVCVEVETIRAAELLRDALNAKLSDPKLHYTQVSMVNLDGGRHIAPCVITRLNLVSARTKQHGYQIRVLESVVRVNNHELTLISTHWTSQLRQRDGSNGESGRENYAQVARAIFENCLKTDPDADVLVCGDFNATPDSNEVRNALGAGGSPGNWYDAGRRPLLMDLLNGKSPQRFGTIFYSGKPLIYDQICVSAGMLDGRGWGCDPASLETVTAGLTRPGATRREPWRFGNPDSPPTGGRGYSDHFPVTLTVTVAPKTAAPAP